MLKRFFELKLASLGFDPSELNISWSVGFCQSDYVLFTGRLRMGTIRKLMMKMHGIDVGPESEVHQLCPDELHEMLKVLEDFGNHDFKISPLSPSAITSIYVDTSDDFEDLFDRYFQPMIATYNDTIPWEKNRVWQTHWKAFHEWLEDWHDQLCHSLLDDAQEIILAGVSEQSTVWERCTPNFIVQVVEGWCDSSYEFVSELDDDLALDQYISLIKGKLRYGELSVRILDRHNHRTLAQSPGYLFMTDNSTKADDYIDLKQCALADAKAEVRQFFARHKVAA